MTSFCTYTNLWNLILICTLNEALSPQKWNGPRLVETLVILTEMEEGQCKFSSWLIHCTNVSLWPTLSLPSQRPWPYLFLLCSLCLWYWLTLGTFPTGILLFVLNKISYKSRMTHNWPYSRGWPWTPEPLATTPESWDCRPVPPHPALLQIFKLYSSLDIRETGSVQLRLAWNALCRLGWPWLYSIPSGSASWVLGLQRP